MILQYKILDHYGDLPILHGGYKIHLMAAIKNEIILRPMEIKNIPTGIALTIPLGCLVYISSEIKYLNRSIETIPNILTQESSDEEINVAVRNHSLDKDVVIKFGDVIGKFNIAATSNMTFIAYK